jgi:cytochrome c-type biogenesis protein CcmH/NrfG
MKSLRFLHFLAAYAAGSWRGSIDVGARILSDPKAAPGRWFFDCLARAYLELGDEGSAACIYERALKHLPESTDLRCRALVIRYRAENWERVIDLASPLLVQAAAPNDIRLFYWLARAHSQLGDAATARRVYECALERFPGNTDLRQRVMKHRARGDVASPDLSTKAAPGTSAVAASRDGALAEAVSLIAGRRRKLVASYYKAEDWRAVVEHATLMLEDPVAIADVRLHHWLARAHLQLGDRSAAAYVYEQGLRHFPGNRDMRRRALVLRYQAGDWKAVIALAEPALDGAMGLDDERAYYWLARAHINVGDPIAASRVYESALQRFPENDDLRRRVVSHKIRQGAWNEICELAEGRLEEQAETLSQVQCVAMVRALRKAGRLGSAHKMIDLIAKRFPGTTDGQLSNEIALLECLQGGKSLIISDLEFPSHDRAYREELSSHLPVNDFGSCIPGRPDWAERWRQAHRSKRVLMIAPKDFSGSMFKLATAVNRHTDYAARLVVFTAHQFGYDNDLIVPECGPERTERFDHDLSGASIVHLKDEQSWHLDQQRSPNLHLLHSIIFGKHRAALRTVFTAYGGYARSLNDDDAWRRAVASFDAYSIFTPDLELDWRSCALLPHSIDVENIQPTWSDQRLLVHSSSTVKPYRKGTDLLCAAISLIESAGFRPWQDWAVDMYTGIPFERAMRRRKDAGLYFDQAGRESTSLTNNQQVIGWYGNAAIECMAMGIPTIVHLDPGTRQRAEKHGLPISLSPVIDVRRDPEDMAEKIMRFVGSSAEDRAELSKKTRDFCIAHHGYKSVAARAERLYSSLA